MRLSCMVEPNDGNPVLCFQRCLKQVGKHFLIGDMFNSATNCHIPFTCGGHVENDRCFQRILIAWSRRPDVTDLLPATDG